LNSFAGNAENLADLIGGETACVELLRNGHAVLCGDTGSDLDTSLLAFTLLLFLAHGAVLWVPTLYLTPNRNFEQRTFSPSIVKILFGGRPRPWKNPGPRRPTQRSLKHAECQIRAVHRLQHFAAQYLRRNIVGGYAPVFQQNQPIGKLA